MLRPALAVFLGSWVGFFLARMRFKYSQAIFFTATVATFLPYQVVLFPLTYLLMRLDVITLGTVVSGDTVLLHGTHWGVEKTIAHELSHVVVHLATENPYADLPAWLDEGLAMYNEGELPAANREALERAICENRLISVRFLTAPTGKPEEIHLFYGEVYGVVEFLLKTYGKEKMAELLAVFKEGAAYDDALTKVYGFDQDGLDAQWRESLGLAPRGAIQATPEATATPMAEKPRGGLCFGMVPGLALLTLFAILLLRKA